MTLRKRRRHVALRYAQCEAFHHGGFPYSGFAGENRIVLAASHQNVDHLANFKVAPQHGIDLAGLGFLGEIDGELVEVGSFSAGTRAPEPARRARRQRHYGGLRLLARIADNRGKILAQANPPESSETRG
jgi:hypothetical protein